MLQWLFSIHYRVMLDIITRVIFLCTQLYLWNMGNKFVIQVIDQNKILHLTNLGPQGAQCIILNCINKYREHSQSNAQQNMYEEIILYLGLIRVVLRIHYHQLNLNTPFGLIISQIRTVKSDTPSKYHICYYLEATPTIMPSLFRFCKTLGTAW